MGDDSIDLARREFAEIPVVDLRRPSEELVPALAQACEHPGFFYLEGLPDAVLPAADAAMDAARRFFRLPDRAKLALSNGPELQYQVRNPQDGQVHAVPGSGNGYRAAGADIYFAKDQRESINFGREPLEPGEDPPYRNLWPAEQPADRHTAPANVNVLPPGWRARVLAHQHQMVQLSVLLRRLVALALGAPADAFDEFFDRPTYQTGMVYYHAVVSDPGQAVFSIRPHADGGLFTILANDGEPGLHICPGKEVAPRERVWIPVPPRAGSLVVNLGGELERWSNGRFKATLHCVVNETGRERFSLPFFYEPNIDAKVQPLPCTGEPRGRWATGPISPEQKLLRGLGLGDKSAASEVAQGRDTASDTTTVAVGEYFHRPPPRSSVGSKL